MKAFEHRALASAYAAEVLANALRQALDEAATANFVVSGGTTPIDCFGHLSREDLEWNRVRVTLTDERRVPLDHPDRNEAMVRHHLMTRRAEPLEFVDLESLDSTTTAASLVGMGADGHFASLFPDIDALDEALDLQGSRSTIAVRSRASEHERVSMTLSRLVNTKLLCLLAFGADKRQVLENPQGLPIEHLLNQSRVSPLILWAP